MAPLIFGALVDHHAYHAIFFGIAALFATAIFSVFTLGQRQTAKAGLSLPFRCPLRYTLPLTSMSERRHEFPSAIP